MKVLKTLSITLVTVLALNGLGLAQTWHRLKNSPTFSPGTALLLTDGRVMVQDSDASDWWALTPDQNANYLNGTWTQLANMPTGYGPLYFSSAVLPDGRVIVEGGEYNLGNSQVETNKGAIYDPIANSWTTVLPPTGWANIGDAQSVILANGTYMQADAITTGDALLNPTTLTWTGTGTGKQDRNDEEGWTLLPDGTVLTVDALDAPNAEKYLPTTGAWISAGNTIVRLEDPSSQEIGPAVLRPDGTVFATGATGHTAIYTPPPTDPTQPGTWAVGPNFPIVNGQQLDIADGPAALLPSGNVLCAASPGIFNNGIEFFEFDGTNLNQVPGVPDAGQHSSFEGRMLVLPTGQILYTDGTSDVEVYEPTGKPNSAWAPKVTSAPSQITPGQTYTISGTLFNGMSQGAAYGDDAQMATNYPIVGIYNRASKHIFIARSHDHSSMGVQVKGTVSTKIDIPSNVETGPSYLVVVANGIQSRAVPVTVQ